MKNVQELELRAKCECGAFLPIVETEQVVCQVCHVCSRCWQYTCTKVAQQVYATHHKFEGEWHWEWRGFE